MSEYDLREQLRAAEEAEDRRQREEFSKKENEHLEQKAQTPKENPLGEEHLRRQAQNRAESGVNKKNPVRDPDRERLRSTHAQIDKSWARSMRDRRLVEAMEIGATVILRCMNRESPSVRGRVSDIDWEYGQVQIVGVEHSEPATIIIQMKRISSISMLRPEK